MESRDSRRPALVVLSTLFPSRLEPVAGVFIKERMFRVARHLPVTVISPQPWFPFQGWVRRWKPNYRLPRESFEVVEGVEVHRPFFFALPGLLRRFDGFSIALSSLKLLRRLQRQGRADVLDVHFAYPDGYAGSLLAKWSGLPFTLTLRGKEEGLRRVDSFRRRMTIALKSATRVIAVSEVLRQVAIQLGAPSERALFIGNGVDLEKFTRLSRSESRQALGIQEDAEVLVSVGRLGEGKGFHRLFEIMPALLERHPTLMLLIAGGPSPDGDWTDRLHQLVRDLHLEQRVKFLGTMAPDKLKGPLSAADVFVLATRYEGWANVFLEAMACGAPVVSTKVGGNAEVIRSEEVGTLVPFGDPAAMTEAIHQALVRHWDLDAIQSYARANAWDRRIETLLQTFDVVYRSTAKAT